jgi:hypothetical protein
MRNGRLLPGVWTAESTRTEFRLRGLRKQRPHNNRRDPESHDPLGEPYGNPLSED